jgi:hypothetical protein
MMEFIFWLAFSALVAWFASSRSRNPWIAFFVSLLLSPLVAIIIYLIMGYKKQCPHCGGSIRNDVTVCRHCGRDV